MSERIRVDLVDSYDESSHTDRVGVDADVDIDVNTSLTISGRLGMIAMYLGGALIVIGSMLFLYAYPDIWYARSVGFDESKTYIKAIIGSLSAGVLLLIEGLSLYFFGRHVNGRGTAQKIRLDEQLEVSHE